MRGIFDRDGMTKSAQAEEIIKITCYKLSTGCMALMQKKQASFFSPFFLVYLYSLFFLLGFESQSQKPKPNSDMFGAKADYIVKIPQTTGTLSIICVGESGFLGRSSCTF